MCALVACLNAVSWSFITPPFEVPDEPAHIAYVKQIAETGTLPTSNSGQYSGEEAFDLLALRFRSIHLYPEDRAIFTSAQLKKLSKGPPGPRSALERGSSAAGVAKSEPPLYYALEAIPFDLGSAGTLLDRIALMRLLSALMAGLTALFVFLFLREALPRRPAGWTVGALCVALSPLFGFISGAVNPDAMLFAVSAALFFCIARAFRRELSSRLAVATGCVIAVGLLTKLNFIGLVPGALLALGVLTARSTHRMGLRAVRAPILAAAIGCAPVVVFAVANALSNRPTLGIASTVIDTTGGSMWREASYIWQLYLPRLPGMANDFPGLFTTRQIWFDGYVGRFGWLDTFFPAWVYTLALVAAGLVAALCARTLIARRAAVRRRLAELAVYALLALGLMLLVAADSYRMFPRELASYGEARYLLPLLPLLGAVLALAVRAAGRRREATIGALIAVVFLAHCLFSQLQVVARYYG